MGLASTQARFLGVTARKSDCEFESMRIAQQKLSVTRDMMTATDQYQSALNQTKLIWDLDGTGASTFDLSYDLMMTPSMMNNYEPYILTSRTGQVVLNSKMAAAAKAAGMNQDGGKTLPTKDGRDAFLEQLGVQGYVAPSVAEKIAANNNSYSKLAGMGGEPLNKTAASTMNINGMINYSDDIIADYNNGTLPDDKTALAEALKFNFGSDTGINLAPEGGEAKSLFLVNNTITQDTEFNLSKLLTDDITLATTTTRKKSGLLGSIGTFLVGSLIGGFVAGAAMTLLKGNQGKDSQYNKLEPEEKALVDFVVNLYEALGTLLVKDDQTTNTQALEFAMMQTIELLSGNSTNMGSRNHSGDAFNDAINDANKHNGWVEKTASKDKTYNTSAISLSNLTRSFLTYYAQALDGYNSGYGITKASQDSVYATDDFDYYYVVGDITAITEKDLLVADFYNSLYNNICANGWATSGGDMDDKEYLSHALKNGQLFISSLNTDGYYYQDVYTRNDYVNEVDDTDAITRAEQEFTQKKNRLNYKEQRLDLQMKNIDTELSALTTEYDAVKNMIGKNTEKVFTMFQS